LIFIIVDAAKACPIYNIDRNEGLVLSLSIGGAEGGGGSGCRVPGVRCRVRGVRYRVKGIGFRFQGKGCEVQGVRGRVGDRGAGVRVQGARFKVKGIGFRVGDSGGLCRGGVYPSRQGSIFALAGGD
jgi:hypothetical protein